MSVIQFERYICSAPNFRLLYPLLPYIKVVGGKYRVGVGGCCRVGWVVGIIFDFQYKMSLSIRMRGGTPTLSISL